MATKSVSTKTIENVFQACRHYGWVLWGSSNVEITREVFRIDNPYPNEFKSLVHCIANFKQVKREAAIHAFLEFVICAVNQLEVKERQLLFERYFWNERYKSDAAHGSALGIPKHRYKKQMNLCRQKMIELLGLEGITLNIPKGAKDW
ncbi:hypothetical protein [Bacillus albus]|uniref:hypothetical protein n=1 Tax=Bacillus albus TaxID=2026189 RepID=UPI00101F4C29|nr:hypothetical protein [Bacillus albus]